jgi:hypothetical protein
MVNLETRCVHAESPQAYDYPNYAFSPPERSVHADPKLNAFGWDDFYVSMN